METLGAPLEEAIERWNSEQAWLILIAVSQFYGQNAAAAYPNCSQRQVVLGLSTVRSPKSFMATSVTTVRGALFLAFRA